MVEDVQCGLWEREVDQVTMPRPYEEVSTV